MDITILCNLRKDQKLIDDLMGIAENAYFQIYNINNRHMRSKIRKTMYNYSSTVLPFILVQDGKEERGFYSETGDNAINQLINFINNGNKI